MGEEERKEEEGPKESKSQEGIKEVRTDGGIKKQCRGVEGSVRAKRREMTRGEKMEKSP